MTQQRRKTEVQEERVKDKVRGNSLQGRSFGADMGTGSSRHQSTHPQQPSASQRPTSPERRNPTSVAPNPNPPSQNPNPHPGYNPPNQPPFFPQPYPHPRAAAPYYTHPPPNPYLFPPPTNGQFYIGGPIRPPPSAYLPPAPMPVAMQEPQRAAPIRNDVNLKKQSLRLEKDGVNPGFWLVAFSFDASLAGR